MRCLPFPSTLVVIPTPPLVPFQHCCPRPHHRLSLSSCCAWMLGPTCNLGRLSCPPLTTTLRTQTGPPTPSQSNLHTTHAPYVASVQCRAGLTAAPVSIACTCDCSSSTCYKLCYQVSLLLLVPSLQRQSAGGGLHHSQQRAHLRGCVPHCISHLCCRVAAGWVVQRGVHCSIAGAGEPQQF